MSSFGAHYQNSCKHPQERIGVASTQRKSSHVACLLLSSPKSIGHNKKIITDQVEWDRVYIKDTSAPYKF